jgi:exodeoxyribonuclease VII large subunit
MASISEPNIDPQPVSSGPSEQTGNNVTIATYGVGQIAGYLRELIETDQLLRDLWVSGEVTNFSRSQAGHVYFTLADDDGALRCVFFRRENQGVDIAQGDQVLVHGRVSLYVDRGELQLYVDALQPEGVGVLHAEFQRLLAQLEAEGLFDVGRKRSLPQYPRRIGVVTSPAGAVWHDIQSVAARRWPMTDLVLEPCRVQGDGAAATIVAAIEALNGAADARSDSSPDLIFVARGGGSIEDLWPFNEEIVARAIFASALPVVSAVGHETDYTIADHVADLRAPTPSAAAELALPNQDEERANLRERVAELGRALERRAGVAQMQLASFDDRLDAQRPDVDAERLRLDALVDQASARVTLQVGMQRTAFAVLQGRLSALNPRATLARGYAIVQDAGGGVLRRASATRPGDVLHILLEEGTVGATVTNVDNKPARKR